MRNKSLIEHISFFAIIAILLGIMIFAQKNPNDVAGEKIVGIHIKGEVNAPGYYELEYGSRIKDAILTACGETEDADLSNINLAMQLQDGEEIIISKVIDKKEENDSDLIDINTADMYQLCKLDGIGEAISADIIEYRTKNGKFKTIDELKKIKGIGKAKLDAIKDKITVK